jgi:HipA-like protein
LGFRAGRISVSILQQCRPKVSGEDAEHKYDQQVPETALRFSLAGAQLKFSALMEAAGGLAIPTAGIGGSWIVKLPSGRFPAVPENEYTMMALARAIGIQVPRTKLLEIRDVRGLPPDIGTMQGKVLAVERCDRGPNRDSIHREDFAQVVWSIIPRMSTIIAVTPISRPCCGPKPAKPALTNSSAHSSRHAALHPKG